MSWIRKQWKLNPFAKSLSSGEMLIFVVRVKVGESRDFTLIIIYLLCYFKATKEPWLINYQGLKTLLRERTGKEAFLQSMSAFSFQKNEVSL